MIVYCSRHVAFPEEFESEEFEARGLSHRLIEEPG
jgi:hypothetical protein